MAKDPSQHNACGLDTRESAHLQPSGAGGTLPASPPQNGGGEVYVALITANVLRLRREWALAEAKCSEVLQLDPENATAHSLMGDILRDQGRVDDAIEWYKLALDHNPGSEADRKKLEALIDQVFAERPKSVGSTLRSSFSGWAKAATEQLRAARPVCPWATVVAGVLGVTMLVAFAAVLIGRRPVAAPQASPGPAGTGAFVVDARTRGEAQPLQTALPLEITGDIAALEQTMFERLTGRAAEIDPNCRVAGVEIDPKQASVVVRLSMPELWSPQDQRAGLLRVAGALAVTAVTSEGALAAVKVRGSTRSAAGPDRLALVADGSAEAIRGAEEARAAASPRELFDSIWWRPELAESGGDRAAGGP
jgi:hypothetical protein